MLNEITRRQHQLVALAFTFQNLRSFDRELKRTTKNKPFRIGNDLAWDAVRSLYRTIVIDLSEWVKSIHAKWLRANIQGKSFTDLRASRTRVARLLKDSKQAERIPKDIRRSIMRQQEDALLSGQRDALRRLFGDEAAARGFAEAGDITKLETRLRRWAKRLDDWRNFYAHPFGPDDPTLRPRLTPLAKRFQFCGRLMNDLRMLTDASVFLMPPLEPREKDAHARDLLDLIVMGTIHHAVDQWKQHESEAAPILWDQRDVHYAQMHACRRKKKSDPFNEYRPAKPKKK